MATEITPPKPNWEVVKGLTGQPLQAKKEPGYMYFLGPVEKGTGISTLFRAQMSRRQPLSDAERKKREAEKAKRHDAAEKKKEGRAKVKAAEKLARIAKKEAEIAKLKAAPQ